MVETPNQPGANAGTIAQAADIKAGWDAAFGISGQSSRMSATEMAAVVASGNLAPAARVAGAEQPSAADIKAGWDAALSSAIADRSGLR